MRAELKKAAANKPAKKKAARPARPLAAKRLGFIAAYLANGLNGAKAARSAGYSAKTAESQASRLLADPRVKAEIERRTQPVLAKHEITAQWVLDELAKVARHDPRKLWDARGEPLPITQLGDDEAAAITGFEVRESVGKKKSGRVRKIRTANRLDALELLGKYFKLFTDKIEHSGVVHIRRVLLTEKTTRLKPTAPEKPEFEK